MIPSAWRGAVRALAVIVAALASQAAAAQSVPPGMAVHEQAKALPEIAFEDGDGTVRSLDGFHGRVVLLNVWATWCGPCRREMPTLDRLQAELGGVDFEVVALSVDRAGVDAVRQFYAEIGVRHLAIYIDESMRAMRQLGVLGLPTTLLLDRGGREIARLIGPAEWDSPEMIAFLRATIDARTGGHYDSPVRSAEYQPAAAECCVDAKVRADR